jgi:hypothetical protein
MKRALLIILTAVTLINAGAEDLPGPAPFQIVTVGKYYSALLASSDQPVSALIKGVVDKFEDIPANGFSQPGDCWYIREFRQYVVFMGGGWEMVYKLQ